MQQTTNKTIPMLAWYIAYSLLIINGTQFFCSYSKWSTHTRRVSLINASVQFGGPITKESFKPLGNNATILSREISTVKLRLTPSMVTTTSTPPTISTPPSEAEREVLESIKGNERLSNIYDQVLEAEHNN